MVVCEYCDARVELVRRAAVPAARPSSPHRHVASSHFSVFAWVLFVMVLVTGVGGLVAFVTAGGILASVLQSFEGAPAPAEPPEHAAVVPGDRVPSTPVVVPAASPEPHVEAADVVTEPASPASPASPETPAVVSKKTSTPKAPTGPVITVAEAKAQLEPKVLACMRSTGTHSILAYMGNKDVGPVSVLSDARTRVDGLRTKLGPTKLGRCMNDAGKSVRTRATKSSYVRFQLTNKAVPDPLAGLPAKSNRKAIEAVVAAVEPAILACARKHGEEGSREVFYFRIDGPTGKIISVRASHGSRKFRSCAEAVYGKLTFAKVQEHESKYTHQLQM